MDYGNINLKLCVLSVLILIVVGVLYIKSFKDDQPSCDNYITNVYLYVLLGLLITAFSVLFIAKRNYAITGTKSLIAFVVAIMSIFGLYAISPSRVLLNHLVWLAFIVSISVSVFVVWRYSQLRGTLTNSLIMVSLLVAGLSAIAHLKPDWIKLSWGPVLTVFLFAGLLAWIIPLFIKSGNMNAYYKMLSALFVFLFAILVLYDTKVLRKKAEMCTIPDYPTDSLGLFLDVINLFNFTSIF